MANKVQAKAAVDSAAIQIKADIDAILPVGVNIIDGVVNFAPIRWTLTIDAGGLIATAETLAATIVTNLNAAARPPVLSRARRGDDAARIFTISTALAVYRIVNF
jgi:hypothetical protein